MVFTAHFTQQNYTDNSVNLNYVTSANGYIKYNTRKKNRSGTASEKLADLQWLMFSLCCNDTEVWLRVCQCTVTSLLGEVTGTTGLKLSPREGRITAFQPGMQLLFKRDLNFSTTRISENVQNKKVLFKHDSVYFQPACGFWMATSFDWFTTLVQTQPILDELQ